MYIIVGLGNPGSEYEGTRHNLGFQVIDRVAVKARLDFSSHHGYHAAAGSIAGERIVLVKPQTYMNNSGEAVRTALERYGGAPDRLLVCCDDFHLPFGRIRLRKKGSDGGHNGLTSVIREIGTASFIRLRCGIGGETMPGPGEGMAEYVLSPFTEKEAGLLPDFIAGAGACIVSVVRDGVDRTMNRVHQHQE